MSAYIQSNQPITLPTGNVTISATDAGKIFLIPAQGAASITLPTGASTPPAVPGMHYRFIMAGAAAGAITIGTGAAGGLGGVALTGNTTVPVVAANLTVGFSNTATFGDYIDVHCISSTTWSVSGGSQGNGGIAVANPPVPP